MTMPAASPRKPPLDERARLVRLIHVAKRELQLDDDTYRAMLASSSGGLTSTTAMSEAQLQAVLVRAKRAGFKVRTAGAQPRRLDLSPEARKVRALWLFLNHLGAVRDPGEAALGAYCRRIAKVSALQWASRGQMTTLTETLKKWALRPAYLPQALVTLHDQAVAQPDLAARPDKQQALLNATECLQRGQGFDAHWGAWVALRRALGRPELPELQPLQDA